MVFMCSSSGEMVQLYSERTQLLHSTPVSCEATGKSETSFTGGRLVPKTMFIVTWSPFHLISTFRRDTCTSDGGKRTVQAVK